MSKSIAFFKTPVRLNPYTDTKTDTKDPEISGAVNHSGVHEGGIVSMLIYPSLKESRREEIRNVLCGRHTGAMATQ